MLLNKSNLFLMVILISFGSNLLKQENKITYKKKQVTFKSDLIQATDTSKYHTPKFENYPILEIFKGVPSRVDFSSNPHFRRFRTVIKDGVKEGANFAGHYRLVEWGCGTSCQINVIVDVKNGKIFSSPNLNTTGGVDFRLNSSLLITNLDNYYQPSYYFNWNGKNLVLLDSVVLSNQEGYYDTMEIHEFTSYSANTIKEGYYVGFEAMESLNPSTGKSEHYGNYPEEKWYHRNEFWIKNDSIKIYKSPVLVRDKDTLYSASDGAFYYYSGFIERKKEKVFAELRLLDCDYCELQRKKVDNKYIADPSIYPYKKYVIRSYDDKIIIDNVEYKMYSYKPIPSYIR